MATPSSDVQSPATRALFTALRELHVRAGEPSSRTIASAIGGTSHTTINLALKGPKVPSWPILAKLVEYLGGDSDRFQELWIETREKIEPMREKRQPEVSVFASYAHVDNDATYGRVSRLIDDIANSYRSMTGREVGVFKDSESIEAGDDWRDRIRLGLSSSSIFLAFISPAYLRSTFCRQEFNEFLGFLNANSSTRLVLPLLFADPARMDSHFANDDLWLKMSRLQRINIAKLRAVDPGSSEWITKVEEIADRVDSVLTEMAPALEERSSLRKEKAETATEDEGETRGMVERMAAIEEESPLMVEGLERFVQLMGRLNEATTQATPKLRRANTFGKKLAVTSALAQQLEPISIEMAEVADRLVAQFGDWGYAVQLLVDLAKSTEGKLDKDLVEFARVVWDLSTTGSDALAQVEGLSTIIEQSVGLSGRLDQPLKAIQKACLRMADLRGILLVWREEIEALQSAYPELAEQ
ncbi:toll/interleukin-1 receptor domain-containing protein [Verrucosispora sp. FIM060022]|uniref:toll/interleukin-1 receptor domain-containing protein n=1 Tax=Verrucosispora sp. FIM060022 TaxID=1479020 RepID=UPI000F88F260|nr:toll/interleukin-1 receptor domain-containing protein [Verrucosispora sp. FIM060022]RUL90860.1 toll/interleukin-1 receptor domain-containing protein [Verrucosispora sp. FIM060022]